MSHNTTGQADTNVRYCKRADTWSKCEGVQPSKTQIDVVQTNRPASTSVANEYVKRGSGICGCSYYVCTTTNITLVYIKCQCTYYAGWHWLSCWSSTLPLESVRVWPPLSEVHPLWDENLSGWLLCGCKCIISRRLCHLNKIKNSSNQLLKE